MLVCRGGEIEQQTRAKSSKWLKRKGATRRSWEGRKEREDDETRATVFIPPPVEWMFWLGPLRALSYIASNY